MHQIKTNIHCHTMRASHLQNSYASNQLHMIFLLYDFLVFDSNQFFNEHALKKNFLNIKYFFEPLIINTLNFSFR